MSSSRTILLIGATSSLTQAIAHVLAESGYRLVLVGRDESELSLLASDLSARYQARCRVLVSDLMEAGFSPKQLIVHAGAFDDLLISTGNMGSGDQDDPAMTEWITQINYIVPAQIVSAAAEQMASNGRIVIISSVAGDRGRQSNYLYGSAKAALSTFASGLRNRLSRQDIHVMTVKPGFVDTPMTWGMKSPLIAKRETVAGQIVTAMEKRKNIVYVPFFWRFIMLIIMHIPEQIFKKLKL